MLLVLGVPASVTHTALPAVPGAVLYIAIGVVGLAALLSGVRRRRVRPTGPSVLIAAGLLSFLVGDLVWYVYDLVLGVGPFPSLADLFYLLGYPLLAGGLAWLATVRGGRLDRETLLDTAIVTVGAGVYAWVYLVAPAATDVSLSLPGRMISAAYPVGDLLVLAAFLRLLFTDRRPAPAAILLLACFVMLLVGDVAFNIGQLLGSGAIDTLANVGYATSYVFAGAAGLHPSITALGDRRPSERAALTRRRLVLLAVAALLAPALLAVQTLWDQQVSGLVIALTSAILFLLVVARMSGLLAELERRAAEVEQMAHSDGLTGLMNRRAWDERLPVEVARARRGEAPVAVALLDIDEFKAFNDRHGHQAGDGLLRAAADAWTAQLRSGDVLARYGGEEFGVILPDCDIDVARRIVERLRSAARGGCTCSAGVAVWEPGMSVTQLVAAADAALYRAKRAGRDRTVVAAQVAAVAVPPGLATRSWSGEWPEPSRRVADADR